ncbi:dephospho-CoA kinase [Trueperella sp. LYQ143]|uniref:dephospho-CoA kinase n=1 Tax=unclassified Trueperella TaxID=2630174 RepID=UPI0039831F5F
MLTLAITGGIGSGKSTVAQIWKENGATVIDADAIARQILLPGSEVVDRIVEHWGADILTADGHINRPELARRVFQDPAARHQLEMITHPAINKRVDNEFAAAVQRDPHGVVIYDVPLLVGSPRQFSLHANIAVSTREDVRVSRLITYRGISREDACARISSQVSDSQREQIADVVIHNNGSVDELRVCVQYLWHEWVEPFRQRLMQPCLPIPQRSKDDAYSCDGEPNASGSGGSSPTATSGCAASLPKRPSASVEYIEDNPNTHDTGFSYLPFGAGSGSCIAIRHDADLHIRRLQSCGASAHIDGDGQIRLAHLSAAHAKNLGWVPSCADSRVFVSANPFSLWLAHSCLSSPSK